jgi:hypothetical protein
MRRRLLKAAADLQEGRPPYAASDGNLYRLRGAEVMLPPDTKWDEDERTIAAMTAHW